jgi:hypothetical protein
MKAKLAQKEPEIIKKWDEIKLYHKIQKRREHGDSFVLHDGPPYANGNIHLGTALNKILKDFIIKSKNMLGLKAPYVPNRDPGRMQKICPKICGYSKRPVQETGRFRRVGKALSDDESRI